MERSEYPKMLGSLQPSQAVDVLTDRVRTAEKLNSEVADWLQERRKLEETYSAGLRKLSRKQLEGVDLGVFASPWNSLTHSCEELAEAHSSLASKIEVDVERPLRDFAGNNREMQAMSTIQGNLRAIAKEFDRAQEKIDKQRAKGERSDTGRAATAHSEMENAQNQWHSQAPYVFENLQAVDESRLNHLRDVLTQFQTHEVDQVEKSRVTAEGCLNVLLNVETADEIKAFALRASEGRPPTSREVGTPSRSANVGPSTPSLNVPDEDLSRQRSGSVQQEKPEKEKKSAFGGLKRLGTVMGRKRESKIPAGFAGVSDSPPERPERKQARPSPFNSLSSRMGRNKDSQILEPPQESPKQKRPHSPLRLGSEMMEPPQQSQELPNSAARDINQKVNGTSEMPENIAPHTTAPPTLAPIPSPGHQGDLADLDPPKASEPPPVAPAAIEQDNDGFSIPSQSLGPITQAQQEAAAEGGQPQYNVNIRNAPIQEEGGDADNALQNMAQKLQMQAPPPTQRRMGTVRGRREARNSAFISSDSQSQVSSTHPTQVISSPAADVPATSPPADTSAPPPPTERSVGPAPSFLSPDAPAAAPNGAFPIPLASTTPAAFRPMSPQGALGSDNIGGDNQSIRSGRSLSSTTSQANRHPELHQTGLNTSVIETISARFENGQIASTSLIGELALAYNAPGSSTCFGTETIRLDTFSGIDKVAPNPAFVSQTSGKEGEYKIDLSNLSRMQIGFKYQVRVDDATTQAPLIINPAFRIEANQTSVIVSYSLNPALALQGRESFTLSNVMLGITLEGAKATSCQSKPVGTFAREKNLIFWQLGDIVLKPGAAPEKLLARFATDVEAKNGSVEAKWEIGGENAQSFGSGLTVSVQGQSGAADASDPFADEDAAASWQPVNSIRKLVSGNYVAKR